MAPPRVDAFGMALIDYLEGTRRAMIVERDDGYIEPEQLTTLYFAGWDGWLEADRLAAAHARGSILDVGCGAGRFLLHFKARGHATLGVDVSPGALEVCRRRGAGPVKACSVTQVSENLGRFGTIIMMGNNLGLLGNRRRARWLLRRFAAVTGPSGRILFTVVNPYATENPYHLAYHKRNRARGRMAGQLRLRIRYANHKGDWFDYLFVSPGELAELASGTGWQLSEVFGDPSAGIYGGMLES